MNARIPFRPLTPESLARLTPAEQYAFATATTRTPAWADRAAREQLLHRNNRDLGATG